jgi:phosphoribosylamine---glycine ligase
MKALVIGGGGREHALAWKLSQAPSIEAVYATPGNAGIAMDVSCIPGDTSNPAEMAALAETLGVDFTVVGPEAPLVAGVVDAFQAKGLPIVGPTQAAAQLEASKVFCKRFLEEFHIPTAAAETVETIEELDAALDKIGVPVALKADGLAAGKGVILADDLETAKAEGRRLLSGEAVGSAGQRLLVEQFLVGREVSFIVLAAGRRPKTTKPRSTATRARIQAAWAPTASTASSPTICARSSWIPSSGPPSPACALAVLRFKDSSTAA